MDSEPGCAPEPAGPSWVGAGPSDGPGCPPELAPAPGDGSGAKRTARSARSSGDPDGPPARRKPGDTVRASWIRARSGGFRGRPTSGWRGGTEPGPPRPARGLAIGRPDRSARSRGRVRGEEGHPAGSADRPRSRDARVAGADGRDRGVTGRLRPVARATSKALWLAGFPARTILIGLIWTYRLVLGGWLGGQCRFYPSCSYYAERAIRARGAVVGSALAAWRLLRCNPFNPGGVDHAPGPRRGPRSGGEYETLIHQKPSPPAAEVAR